MPAYVIVDLDITEPEAYEAYRREVPATMQPYGQVRAWYDSAAYQAILPIRQQHARTHFMLVAEGVA